MHKGSSVSSATFLDLVSQTQQPRGRGRPLFADLCAVFPLENPLENSPFLRKMALRGSLVAGEVPTQECSCAHEMYTKGLGRASSGLLFACSVPRQHQYSGVWPQDLSASFLVVLLNVILQP